MAITQQAKSVIERPLDPSRIKKRQGGNNMTFDYIGTEHAIQLLNEAFDYAWNSTVIKHEIFDGLAVALVELKVWDDSGSPITKQQFGSCNINRGVDTGAALKGAASDGLKKCASQLGVALELYLDDIPSSNFKAPARPAAPSAPKPPSATPPAAPKAPPAPPPRPPSSGPPRPPTTGLAVPPSPPGPPTRPNPFNGQQGGGSTAPVAKPAPPVIAAPPIAPPPVAVNASRPNPFGGNGTDKEITTVQHSALMSISAKKEMSHSDLIQLAGITDAQGVPKQTFEDLTHSEAIDVVKAAQLK